MDIFILRFYCTLFEIVKACFWKGLRCGEGGGRGGDVCQVQCLESVVRGANCSSIHTLPAKKAGQGKKLMQSAQLLLFLSLYRV
jgi:hypothetical protein